MLTDIMMTNGCVRLICAEIRWVENHANVPSSCETAGSIGALRRLPIGSEGLVLRFLGGVGPLAHWWSRTSKPRIWCRGEPPSLLEQPLLSCDEGVERRGEEAQNMTRDRRHPKYSCRKEWFLLSLHFAVIDSFWQALTQISAVLAFPMQNQLPAWVSDDMLDGWESPNLPTCQDGVLSPCRRKRLVNQLQYPPLTHGPKSPRWMVLLVALASRKKHHGACHKNRIRIVDTPENRIEGYEMNKRRISPASFTRQGSEIFFENAVPPHSKFLRQHVEAKVIAHRFENPIFCSGNGEFDKKQQRLPPLPKKKNNCDQKIVSRSFLSGQLKSLKDFSL